MVNQKPEKNDPVLGKSQHLIDHEESSMRCRISVAEGECMSFAWRYGAFVVLGFLSWD